MKRKEKKGQQEDMPSLPIMTRTEPRKQLITAIEINPDLFL